MTAAPLQLSTQAVHAVEVEQPENPSQETTTEVIQTDEGPKVRVSLTPAYKDNSREIVARSQGTKPIYWAAIGLCVLGIASFTPYGKLAGLSTSTGLIGLILGGSLFFVPGLIEKSHNQTLLIVACFGGLGVWVLARRYGKRQDPSLPKMPT